MDVTLFPLEPDAACRRFFIRADGQHAVAQVAPENAASLALHRSLGFEVASKDISAITLKKIL